MKTTKFDAIDYLMLIWKIQPKHRKDIEKIFTEHNWSATKADLDMIQGKLNDYSQNAEEDENFDVVLEQLPSPLEDGSSQSYRDLVARRIAGPETICDR